MEFSLNVCSKPNGLITVEDWAKKYGQYLNEDIDTLLTSFDTFKYSETASINTIIKVELDKSELIDVLLDNHEQELDSVTFEVTRDGYYTLDHIVLPNLKWWDNATEALKDHFATIYLTDGEKVYKVIDDEPVECSIKEIIDRNPEDTTLLKCHSHVFFVGNLLNCYIDWCKKIFDSMLNTCNKGLNADAIYARDFLWMTLNIIEYLTQFKQYMEAERILELLDGCGGFCKNKNVKKSSGGCGCS